MLNKKIDNALLLIEETLNNYANPIIMSSFGKDSMVMIDLVRKINKNIPCLMHREPFYPKKYSFPNRVIEDWELTIYDYCPVATQVQTKDIENKTEIEILNYYQCGTKSIVLPTGIIEPEDYSKPYLCGFIDLLNKPLGTFQYKWDLCFIGHKSSDQDYFYNSLELDRSILKTENGSPDICYPLRFFNDQDIWEYTDRYNVPWNDKRYDRGQSPEKETFRGQFKDMTYNPDYFECCTKCLNKKLDKEVFCPKLNKLVLNISDKVPYLEESLKFEHFG